MGFASSLHCVGMCGPIALALPFQGKSKWQRFGGFFLYTTGRLITYALLGVVVGSIGKSFALVGLQQILSVSVGAAVILFVIADMVGRRIRLLSTWCAMPYTLLQKRIGPLLHSHRLSAKLAIGFLNGLLPCGMVYMALASCLSRAAVSASIAGMLAFGAGTLPAFLLLYFFRQQIGNYLRQKFKRAVPIMLVATAMLLLVRGLNLGIPYISPKAVNGTLHTFNCCHK